MNKNENVLAIHMGNEFEQLPQLLQKAHSEKKKLSGSAKVQRGNVFARLICTLLGFPEENPNCKLTVICEHNKDTMDWTRNFNGLIMKSSFRKQGEYLVEYLGPLAMSFRAKLVNNALHYQFIKTRFFGIRIPGFLSPNIIAYEQEDNAQYRFSVEVKLPIIGKIISYSGLLSVSEI